MAVVFAKGPASKDRSIIDGPYLWLRMVFGIERAKFISETIAGHDIVSKLEILKSALVDDAALEPIPSPGYKKELRALGQVTWLARTLALGRKSRLPISPYFLFFSFQRPHLSGKSMMSSTPKSKFSGR